MKWMMIIAALALAGCQETESKYAGHWQSKHGNAKIKITNDSCRWYLDSGRGFNCEIEGDSLIVKRGSSFTEAELHLVIDEIMLFLPGGGMQVYELASAGS